MLRNVTRIIWHHSAGGSMEGAVAAMKAKGCHYHVLIDQYGKTFKMRSYDLMAYHAGPNGNPNSIGICMIGDFRYTSPTHEQIQKAADLAFDIEKTYGPVNFQNHCDVAATMCPVIDLSKIVRDRMITIEKDRDTQSQKPLDEYEVNTIKKAKSIGLTDEDIDGYDITNFYSLEMCVKLYDILTTKVKEKGVKSDKNSKTKG